VPVREVVALNRRRSRRDESSLGAETVLQQMERILAHGDFDGSPRSRAFFRFIVEETLAGRQAGLTQTAIATQVFGRRSDFDPTVDPIVRIQAGRLRRSIERYYLLAGARDPLRIELPRGAYVPVARPATPAEEGRPSDAERSAPPADDWPTVVVSVSEPIPPDSELDELGARFLDHLAVELGRYGDVRVLLPRESPFPATVRRVDSMFVLTSRFFRDGSGLRLVARLADRRTGSQAWAEEYRSRSSPATAFAAETARVVAASVASEQGVVARGLWAEHRAQPSAELTPYAGILASYQFLFNREPADLAPAISALEGVVAAEPECALAWVQLARLHASNYAFDVAPVETPVGKAVDYAQRGVRLDPSSQRARTTLAGALLLKGELAAALAEARRALDLDPDSLVYLEWIGWVMTLAGEWEHGSGLVRRALSRNPHVIPVAHHALWLAHLRRGEIEEAYHEAVRYSDPTFYLRAMMRACCLGLLGREEEAMAEVAELLAKKPDFPSRGRALIGRLVKFPDLLESVAGGLGRAGLAID